MDLPRVATALSPRCGICISRNSMPFIISSNSSAARRTEIASLLRQAEILPSGAPCCSGDRQAVLIESIALDVIAGRHILQPAGNGRFEPKPTGLVEAGQP